MKTRYRSVFISDTHLGFRGAQAGKLLSFLRHVDCAYLYFVGDTFDFWSLQRKFFWSAEINDVIRRVIKLSNRGVQITLIAGNHDEALRQFLPCDFGKIAVRDYATHTTLDGRQLFLIHGDQFDYVAGHMKWLAKLGSVAYDWLLWSNHYITHARAWIGLPYWSFAAWAKRRAKRAVSAIKDFEFAAMEYAEKQGCTGVICGHIHTPKIDTTGPILYANCGDWVESCSILVEDEDGQLRLVFHQDL